MSAKSGGGGGAVAAGGDHSNRKSAIEELAMVNNKLEEVDRQIQALREKRHTLKERKTMLQSIIDAPIQEIIDWSRTDLPWSAEVGQLRNDMFKINQWRPNQLEVINATLSQRDCFVIMRTGGGKSLCFQLPALLQGKGMTIVISPLISLISDQVYQLEQLSPGIAAQLTSNQSREEGNAALREMKDSKSPLRLVYVTPEKIVKSKLFVSTLEKLSQAGRLERFVIDEAHCVSAYGHDFRPDYAKLSVLRKFFPVVPILCLTATATPQIIADVDATLELRSRELFRSDPNRPNLLYEVVEKPGSIDDAVQDAFDFIMETYPTSSGIIYCYSQKESENVSEKLNSLGISCGVYHAGIDPSVKDYVLKAWSTNRLQCVAATIAFGLGISKSDCRFVIHFSISKSLANYYQESGRAGRDGQPSTCRLMYRASDAVRQANLVLSERAGLQQLHGMVKYAQSGMICRRLLLARSLGESSTAKACTKEGGAACDVCAGRVQRREVDMSSTAKSMISIVRAQNAKEKRVTHKQLADAWLKANKGSKESTYFANREAVEKIINQLVIEDILAEDFHATAYACNSYCVLGYNAGAVERGDTRLMLEIDVADAGEGGGGEKKKKKKAPAAAARKSSGGGGAASSGAAVGAVKKKAKKDGASASGKEKGEDDDVEVVEILSETESEGGGRVKGRALCNDQEEEDEDVCLLNNDDNYDDDDEFATGGGGGFGTFSSTADEEEDEMDEDKEEKGNGKTRRVRKRIDDDDDDSGEDELFVN